MKARCFILAGLLASPACPVRDGDDNETNGTTESGTTESGTTESGTTESDTTESDTTGTT